MRKRVLPPEDTLSANLSAAAAVGCSTPPSTPRNTVTATGAAIRPTIGGSGNTAKCAVRIWSASAAARNSRPNVQMPAIAAMPVGKKTIENVLRMPQVLKMSTWVSVTNPSNKALSLTNEGTEIHRPVTENQVVKMSTSFFVSGELVRGALGGVGTTQCLRCKVCQVEHRGLAHPAAKVAVSCVCRHQKAVWYPEKAHAPPGCGERDLRYGCRAVRLGDLRERKKRPHLVENQILKSLKELFK